MSDGPIKMTHPDLPGQEIWVVNPAGVPIHRQSGWRTEDENPQGKPANASATAASAKTEEK
jgi:hypothetical protein